MSSKPVSSSTMLQLPEGVELQLVVVKMADGTFIVRTPAELELDKKAGRGAYATGDGR